MDGVYADWGTPEQRLIRRATPAELSADAFAEGSMGPKVKAACTFVEQMGLRGDRLDQRCAGAAAGTAGTCVARARPEPLGAATAADWEAAIPPKDS